MTSYLHLAPFLKNVRDSNVWIVSHVRRARIFTRIEQQRHGCHVESAPGFPSNFVVISGGQMTEGFEARQLLARAPMRAIIQASTCQLAFVKCSGNTPPSAG